MYQLVLEDLEPETVFQFEGSETRYRIIRLKNRDYYLEEGADPLHKVAFKPVYNERSRLVKELP